MSVTRPRKVLVIGAGPVGALSALSLYRRGWEVEIWESRDDPRDQDIGATNLRSINLAISARGLEALRSVDPSLAEDFLQEAIPMKGRMIHHVNGAQESQLYDPRNSQCINSISRPLLNLKLVQALPADIAIRFKTKLSRVDFKTNRAYGTGESKAVVPGEEDDDGQIGGKESRIKKGKGREDEEGTPFDLIIGCDGSWSKVRSEMMRVERVDFSQSFIPHAYIELHMPAKPDGGYAIDKNHLHIWPRHAFMLIGLPNKDGSFTLTLFLPFASLEEIQTKDQATRFFRENFPSAVDVCGEKDLVEGLMNNPRGNLVTINVKFCLVPRSHTDGTCLSSSRFYGQGLNCGLEDVRVLNSYLQKHEIPSATSLSIGETDPALADALSEYSLHRDKDLHAICTLALQNYTEMRSHVLTPLHHLRRHLDAILSAVIPATARATLSLTEAFPTRRVNGWTSLYEMVTFRPDVGYSEALRKEKWQKEVGSRSAVGVAAIVALGVGLGGWKVARDVWGRR
ncbi:kynurenine 3-monooxygenase, partial [Tremellales sp. Uapishka_1]